MKIKHAIAALSLTMLLSAAPIKASEAAPKADTPPAAAPASPAPAAAAAAVVALASSSSSSAGAGATASPASAPASMASAKTEAAHFCSESAVQHSVLQDLANVKFSGEGSPRLAAFRTLVRHANNPSAEGHGMVRLAHSKLTATAAHALLQVPAADWAVAKADTKSADSKGDSKKSSPFGRAKKATNAALSVVARRGMVFPDHEQDMAKAAAEVSDAKAEIDRLHGIETEYNDIMQRAASKIKTAPVTTSSSSSSSLPAVGSALSAAATTSSSSSALTSSAAGPEATSATSLSSEQFAALVGDEL